MRRLLLLCLPLFVVGYLFGRTPNSIARFVPEAGHSKQLIGELHVSASVSMPTVQLGASQTVYLVVRDSYGQPVSGAEATGLVRDAATGEGRLLAFPLTDSHGSSAVGFFVESGGPGQLVVIDLVVTYGDIRQSASTSYLVWW